VRLDQVALCHVQVDHGGGDVGMTKQLFERNDVDALFEQMCGVRMSE